MYYNSTIYTWLAVTIEDSICLATVSDRDDVYDTGKVKRVSKRGSVLKVRGGCYNYKFKLYKWLKEATKTVVVNLLWQKF